MQQLPITINPTPDTIIAVGISFRTSFEASPRQLGGRGTRPTLLQAMGEMVSAEFQGRRTSTSKLRILENTVRLHSFLHRHRVIPLAVEQQHRRLGGGHRPGGKASRRRRRPPRLSASGRWRWRRATRFPLREAEEGDAFGPSAEPGLFDLLGDDPVETCARLLPPVALQLAVLMPTTLNPYPGPNRHRRRGSARQARRRRRLAGSLGASR